MPYTPRKEDLAGISLFGRRLPDGSIDLGSSDPINMPAFPDRIEVGGAIWALEGITENEVPPEHPGFGICWGEYV